MAEENSKGFFNLRQFTFSDIIKIGGFGLALGAAWLNMSLRVADVEHKANEELKGYQILIGSFGEQTRQQITTLDNLKTEVWKLDGRLGRLEEKVNLLIERKRIGAVFTDEQPKRRIP